MRNLIFSALILASAFQTAMGAVEGQWTYIVENGGATITASTATGAVTIPSVLGGYAVKKVGNGWPSIFGAGNTSVTGVVIPNSVTSIGDSAFQECTNLASITIGNGVTSIGSRAYYGCTSLTSVTIPNSVTSIGAYAFNNCTGLTSITIPNSVTSIGDAAFYLCRVLTSITIPNSVTSIGDSAFSRCTSLTSITIPNSMTSIGSSAFSGCTSLASITIPNSVTSIGSSAFSGCTSLASITIPNSVTSIGSGAFSSCTSLASITIPNSVTSIGGDAFAHCAGLTSVTIPNSVTSIGAYAFNNCTGLTSITIPNSVTSIGDGAFNNCTGLTSVAMPVSFIGLPTQIGIRGQVASDYIINALANNDAFVTAVANKIKGTSGNYGLTTQTGLSSAIEPLATKTQITTAINEGRASGIASVTASPNTWSLFTTSQIQNMAVGDLVLTRTNGSNLVLNYDIEQSEDLQTWTTYQGYALPLTNLPTNKAFVRIKAKQ